MTGDLPVVRVDDAARDRAVAFLRHHCADGLITLDEFSDRVGEVFAAVTSADIEKVTIDLPKIQSAVSTPATTRSGTRTRRAIRWTVSVMGGSQQRGRWRVEGRTNAISVMGGCLLDLRQAEVVGDEVEITAIACMGGVEIIVPEGIEVVLTGFSLMGGRHNGIKDVPVLPGSPLVRVRAFSLMGGVSVRSKPPVGEGKERRTIERGDRHRHRDELRAARHGMRAGVPGMPAMPDFRDMPGFSGVAGAPDLPGMPGHLRRPERPTSPMRRGIEAVAQDVREQWTHLRAQVAPEGTVTIFFSDIEGFTSMNERLGDQRAQQILRDHYALVREELVRHRGFEVKVHGDGFMVAFDSAARALRCARAIQQRQQAWNAQRTDDAFRVRMGLHTGEAIRDADDFLGSTVNLASRIATAARGGEILVSALLKELCASSGEFDFDNGQEMELKGLSQPHRVFTVRWS